MLDPAAEGVGQPFPFPDLGEGTAAEVRAFLQRGAIDVEQPFGLFFDGNRERIVFHRRLPGVDVGWQGLDFDRRRTPAGLFPGDGDGVGRESADAFPGQILPRGESPGAVHQHTDGGSQGTASVDSLHHFLPRPQRLAVGLHDVEIRKRGAQRGRFSESGVRKGREPIGDRIGLGTMDMPGFGSQGKTRGGGLENPVAAFHEDGINQSR